MGLGLLVFTLIMVVGLSIIIIWTSIFTVEQQTAGIVERWGKFNRIVGPGIHLKLPFIIERVVMRPTLRVQQLDLKMESKSKDDVTVMLQLAIQYRIPSMDKVYDAYYVLEKEPRVQIESWVYDVVRSKVPLLNLNEVYENKDDIAKDVELRLKDIMHQYGFEIVRALVNDVIPPPGVRDAMNEINTQQRLQVAAEAQGERNKILVVKDAEAQAESKRLQGEGLANQRREIVKGYKDSITDFRGEIAGIDPKEIMWMVIVTQYFDTLRELGADARSKVVFLPSNPGAVGSWWEQIQLAFATAAEAKDTHPEELK